MTHQQNLTRGSLGLFVLALTAALAAGCASRHMIVTATGTNIGVEVSQNPANQSPQAKLGYQRTEFAIVPTNRSANEDPGEASAAATVAASTGAGTGTNVAQTGTDTAACSSGACTSTAPDNGGTVTQNGGKTLAGGGAKDLGDVIMELRYGGIFDLGKDSSIYQRLAVGSVAVRQPGAAFMFARDAEGKVDADMAKALAAVQKVPEFTSGKSEMLALIRSRRACHAELADDSTMNALTDADAHSPALKGVYDAAQATTPCP